MLLTLVLAVSVTSATSLRVVGPAHASCMADWTFGISCAESMKAIVNQLTAWSGPDGCASGGEKCLYEYKSTEDNVIKATHTTPVHEYVDDIEMTFTDGDSGGCNMHGFSTSETWYAVLDSSTNFCNMKNLITGAGLDKGDGYSETADDSTCTQYSSADCDTY